MSYIIIPKGDSFELLKIEVLFEGVQFYTVTAEGHDTFSVEKYKVMDKIPAMTALESLLYNKLIELNDSKIKIMTQLVQLTGELNE